MPFHPTGEASRMYSKYDEAQFHLRLPHELHAKIKQRAKMNNRSLNSEIIARLKNHWINKALHQFTLTMQSVWQNNNLIWLRKLSLIRSRSYIKKTATNHPLRRLYAKRYDEYCILHIWFLHVPGVCEAILTAHQT